MKTRPLASPPLAAAWQPDRPLPAQVATPQKPPSTLLAAVGARRPDGAVMKLILPARTAGSSVPFMIPTADGSFITAGSVTSAGVVRPGGMGQIDPSPGSPLRCVMDPAGRILLVQQVAPARTRRDK